WWLLAVAAATHAINYDAILRCSVALLSSVLMIFSGAARKLTTGVCPFCPRPKPALFSYYVIDIGRSQGCQGAGKVRHRPVERDGRSRDVRKKAAYEVARFFLCQSIDCKNYKLCNFLLTLESLWFILAYLSCEREG